MTVRGHHVAADRLTALALVSRAPESALTRDELDSLQHVASCDQCAARFTELASTVDAGRAAAFAEADAVFDDQRLDAQRGRILDRLAHLGQSARVLRFPGRPREMAMPVSTGSRRWVTAAAAGLIIGLVTGQLLHLAPTAPSPAPRDQSSMFWAPLPPGAATRATTALDRPISDDDLLLEVDASVQLRRARSLQALDALTPVAADFRDLPLGR